MTSKERLGSVCSPAFGGKSPLGAPGMMEAQFSTGELYDPARDILNFFPYMMEGVILACENRSIPAIDQAFVSDPNYELRVIHAIKALSEVMEDCSEGEKIGDYNSFVDRWLYKFSDKQAVDFVMRIFGRGFLSFYVECCAVRRREGEGCWPGGAEEVVHRIIDGDEKRTLWQRAKIAFRILLNR